MTGQRLSTERAAELGRKSGEARRARSTVQSQSFDELAAAFARDELGPHALAVAHELIRRVAEREVPVSRWRDVATLIEKLVEVGRLEAGQATSHTASVSVAIGPDDRRLAIDRLRQELDRSALDSASLDVRLSSQRPAKQEV